MVEASVGMPVVGDDALEQIQQHYDFHNCYTAKNPDGGFLEEDVVAAIAFSRGNWSRVARFLNRSRTSVFNYITRDIRLTEFRHEVAEMVMDSIEERTMEVALAGDPNMLRFMLKTVGKDRGYTTRVESTGKDGEALNPPVNVDLSGMPTHQLEDLMKAFDAAKPH